MAASPAADIVVDIDHVTTVQADRPARQIFSALSRLGLFVVWPYASYGGFASGGVRLGNLNLEVIGTSGDAPAAGVAGSGEGGGWPRQLVSLAPASLQGLPAQLDQRGVLHGEPLPFSLAPGGEPLYTTVGLPGLGGPGLAVQFCAYPEGPRTQTVPPRDLAGVQQVDRVVLGASDVGAARQRWAALLAPPGAGPAEVWQPGYGPALEVRPAGADAVLEVVLRVRSLPVARAAFTAAGLSVAGDVVTIGTLPARLVVAR